jgi:hypothetical protein
MGQISSEERIAMMKCIEEIRAVFFFKALTRIPAQRGCGTFVRIVGFVCALGVVLPCIASEPYEVAIDNGLAWLLLQRNPVDGSWGSSDAVRYTQTSEAVLALGALDREDAAYYGGISWLSSHVPLNFDASARKVLTLTAAGGSVGADMQAIQAGQQTGVSGNNGWGLSRLYSGSPLDTAFALQALSRRGISTGAAAAVAYLVAVQLTGADKGWTLGQEGVGDPFTTAQVIIGLKPYNGLHASAPIAITNGLNALNARVNSGSPVSQIAITIVANLRSGALSTTAAALVSALLARQSSNGSWSDDPYATALALRALAAASGRDLADRKQVVSIPDSNLRAAINAALGHAALDAITVGQMRRLTSLSIPGRGVIDLTGLEQALNLAYLDISNNPIASFLPISTLPLSRVVRTGDVDADGMVDIADLHLLQQSLLGSATLKSQESVRADLFPAGGDRAVDISDLWALQRQLLSRALRP